MGPVEDQSHVMPISGRPGSLTISWPVLMVAGLMAWIAVGREVLPLGAFLSIARYAFGKIGLYLRVLSNKTNGKWVRTDRTKFD